MDSSAEDGLNVNVRSSALSTRSYEGVDTDAATGSLGVAEPVTDCVKPPFLDGEVTILKLSQEVPT